MTMLIALFWRDLRRAWGSGALWLPVLFFLLVATAFPFAVGPVAPLLQRAGGGMVWVAALLAALLPIDRLVRHVLIHEIGHHFGFSDDDMHALEDMA